MPVSGGERTPLTTVTEGEVGHYHPKFLPSGTAVLFSVFSGVGSESQVAAYDFDTGERRTLLPGTSPQFAASGHLVFWREGALWAVPFDPDRLEVQGDPLPIEHEVQANPLGFADYTLGEDGMLVYAPATGVSQGPQRTLVWVDREGNEEPVAAEPRPYAGVRLSPDGQRVVTTVQWDIVIYDLGRERPTRLTFDPARDALPTWTPDGEWVVFSSFRTGPANLWRKRADGSGNVERLTTEGDLQAPFSFSPDGKMLVFTEGRTGNQTDIGLLPMDGGSIEWLIETVDTDNRPAVSPDGRWIAYGSDEEGQFEIYVQPFPNADGGRFQISRAGGNSPGPVPLTKRTAHDIEKHIISTSECDGHGTVQERASAGHPRSAGTASRITRPAPRLRHHQADSAGLS